MKPLSAIKILAVLLTLYQPCSPAFYKRLISCTFFKNYFELFHPGYLEDPSEETLVFPTLHIDCPGAIGTPHGSLIYGTKDKGRKLIDFELSYYEEDPLSLNSVFCMEAISYRGVNEFNAIDCTQGVLHTLLPYDIESSKLDEDTKKTFKELESLLGLKDNTEIVNKKPESATNKVKEILSMDMFLSLQIQYDALADEIIKEQKYLDTILDPSQAPASMVTLSKLIKYLKDIKIEDSNVSAKYAIGIKPIGELPSDDQLDMVQGYQFSFYPSIKVQDSSELINCKRQGKDELPIMLFTYLVDAFYADDSNIKLIIKGATIEHELFIQRNTSVKNSLDYLDMRYKAELSKIFRELIMLDGKDDNGIQCSAFKANSMPLILYSIDAGLQTMYSSGISLYGVKYGKKSEQRFIYDNNQIDALEDKKISSIKFIDRIINNEEPLSHLLVSNSNQYYLYYNLAPSSDSEIINFEVEIFDFSEDFYKSINLRVYHGKGKSDIILPYDDFTSFERTIDSILPKVKEHDDYVNRVTQEEDTITSDKIFDAEALNKSLTVDHSGIGICNSNAGSEAPTMYIIQLDVLKSIKKPDPINEMNKIEDCNSIKDSRIFYIGLIHVSKEDKPTVTISVDRAKMYYAVHRKFDKDGKELVNSSIEQGDKSTDSGLEAHSVVSYELKIMNNINEKIQQILKELLTIDDNNMEVMVTGDNLVTMPFQRKSINQNSSMFNYYSTRPLVDKKIQGNEDRLLKLSSHGNTPHDDQGIHNTISRGSDDLHTGNEPHHRQPQKRNLTVLVKMLELDRNKAANIDINDISTTFNAPLRANTNEGYFRQSVVSGSHQTRE